MDFDNVLETKSYFNNINEAKNFRPKLWQQVENKLKNLDQKLFDELSIEESIYIINDFN